MKKFYSFANWTTSCTYATLSWGIRGLPNYLNCEEKIYSLEELQQCRIETDSSSNAILVFEIGQPQHCGLNTWHLRQWFPNAKIIALCGDTQYYQFNNLNPQMDPNGIDLHLEITLSGTEWLKSKGANVDWWHWSISDRLINYATSYKNAINKTLEFVEGNKNLDFIGVYHPYSIANEDGWRHNAIKYILENGRTFTRGGFDGPDNQAHHDEDLMRLFDHYISSWFTLGTTSHNRPEITKNQSAKFFRDELGPILDSLLIYNDCPLIRRIYGDDLVPFYNYDDNKSILDVYDNYIHTDKYFELLKQQKAWVKEHSFEKELLRKLAEHKILNKDDVKE